MAKVTLSNEHTEFVIKYRAVCEDDKYRGDWRENVDEAKSDARNHRSKVGNEEHVIRIVAQQTLTMLFVE